MESKLNDLPPLYYINLDDRDDKRNYMEKMCSTHGITAKRISAINGKQPFEHLLSGQYPKRLKPTEIACSISHLTAIREWYTTSDTEFALICEDDLSLDTVPYWNLTWNQIMERLPFYWDIAQLCITYHPQQQAIVNMHMHQTTDFSCVCYMIRRPYAKKLLDLYWRYGSWKLDYSYPMALTAEELLYKPGSCVSIPLFTYTNEFMSSIQTKEHMVIYHEYSRNLCLDLWRNRGNHDLFSFYPPLVIQKQ